MCIRDRAVRAGSTHFSIPFDRQQLADYLNLDRSALSKELGKMREDVYKRQELRLPHYAGGILGQPGQDPVPHG